jgi:hypothetical protein
VRAQLAQGKEIIDRLRSTKRQHRAGHVHPADRTADNTIYRLSSFAAEFHR